MFLLQPAAHFVHSSCDVVSLTVHLLQEAGQTGDIETATSAQGQAVDRQQVSNCARRLGQCLCTLSVSNVILSIRLIVASNYLVFLYILSRGEARHLTTADKCSRG